MPRAHMKTPCENCPYRTDAPLRLWHRSEFERLLATEADAIGSTYACHKQADLAADARGFCAGWLLDQKRRGVPSIALRVALINDVDQQAAFDAVDAAGLTLYPSVKAMCLANGVRRASTAITERHIAETRALLDAFATQSAEQRQRHGADEADYVAHVCRISRPRAVRRIAAAQQNVTTRELKQRAASARRGAR